MGSFYKKALGFGALGAAAGAVAYYLKKQKEKDPQLEEDFADFHDNIKETASSAANVASRLKEKVEQTVEETVQKVREHTDDILDDLDNLDDETIFEDDEFFDSPSDTSEEFESSKE